MRFIKIFIFLLCIDILCSNKYVIVVPTYNNISFYEKNMQSIINQEGDFRVIIVDACSSDGTGEAIKKWIDENHPSCKIDMYRNNNREFALQNTYRAVHSCEDKEIIVTVDGDDWLPHNQVLKRLDQEYNKGSWLTYGSFQTFPYNEYVQLPIYNTKISPRSQEWCFSHLRTFYAGLFKQIKTKDFFYQSKFSPVVHDFAMMYPMVEMAQEKISYIPDVMYIYNRANIIAEGYQFPNLCAPVNRFFRSKKSYKSLSSLKKRNKDFIHLKNVNELNELENCETEFIIFGNIHLCKKSIEHLNQTHLNICFSGNNKIVTKEGNIISSFTEKESFYATFFNFIDKNLPANFIIRKKTFQKIKDLNSDKNFISKFLRYLQTKNPLVLYHLQ